MPRLEHGAPEVVDQPLVRRELLVRAREQLAVISGGRNLDLRADGRRYGEHECDSEHDPAFHW
jgi:hypothetical protein